MLPHIVTPSPAIHAAPSQYPQYMLPRLITSTIHAASSHYLHNTCCLVSLPPQYMLPRLITSTIHAASSHYLHNTCCLVSLPPQYMLPRLITSTIHAAQLVTLQCMISHLAVPDTCCPSHYPMINRSSTIQAIQVTSCYPTMHAIPSCYAAIHASRSTVRIRINF